MALAVAGSFITTAVTFSALFAQTSTVPQNATVPTYSAENEQTPRAPNLSSDLSFSPSVLASRTYYEGSETIGRVGNEAILKRDIFHQLKKRAYLEFIYARNKAPEEEKARYNEEMFLNTRQHFMNNAEAYSYVLDEYIKKLLFYNDFVMSRSKEELELQQKNIGNSYDKEYLPQLLQQADCKNVRELEEVFRDKIESSLEQDKRLFIQEQLGNSWLTFNMDSFEYEPTVVDLRRWYEAHLSDYLLPERVQWRRMSVLFANHPSKEAALDKLAYMGDAVRVAKNPEEIRRLFGQVAEADSEDFFASKGGDCGWSKRGDLNSAVVEEALFSDRLPIGALSKIIEEPFGLTILLVTAREPDHYTPFVQVQEEIREKMKEERKATLKTQYENKLAKRFAIEIYTITPEQRRLLEAVKPNDLSATGRDLH